MREPDGYRDYVAYLRTRVDHEMLTIDDVVSLSGFPRKCITNRFTGWTCTGRGCKRALIPLKVFAWQMMKK